MHTHDSLLIEHIPGRQRQLAGISDRTGCHRNLRRSAWTSLATLICLRLILVATSLAQTLPTGNSHRDAGAARTPPDPLPDTPARSGSDVPGGPLLSEPPPFDWQPGQAIPRHGKSVHDGGLVPDNSRDVRWAVPLGSTTWSTPAVAEGRVLIGTNNGAGYLSEFPPESDLGVLLCFEQQSGRFLWQHSNAKLRSGRVHDWPQQGVCSTPLIHRDRVWYVSNRAEIVCLDLAGFYDGEDDGQPDGPADDSDLPHPHQADVVWRLDMIGELGVFPHYMSACSLIRVGDLLFACTGNGVDVDHVRIPAPEAPSFIAVDSRTGAVIWRDSSPGLNILDGQWSSPCHGVFDGQPQVVFAGGDGWVYSFDPRGDGRGASRLLWKFDANPKEAVWRLGGRGTRNSLLANPVVADGLLYVVLGLNPEDDEGPGRIWCIDPSRHTDGRDVSSHLVLDAAGHVVPPRRLQAIETGRGEHLVANPASAVVWTFTGHDLDGDGQLQYEERMQRSMSSPVIHDGLLYVPDSSGILHCLDALTGKSCWFFDLYAACHGSVLVANGHVYVATDDGEVTVFRHSRDPDVAMPQRQPVTRISHSSAIEGTPVRDGNTLFLATHQTLYAIAGADR